MKKIILTATVILTMISCSVEYYPTTYNAPLFNGMEQFEATGSYGNSGWGGQIAYAPVNHFGFIATGSYVDRDENSYFFTDDSENEDGDPDFHKHLFGEAGIGYFTGMGSKGAFEIYGGYGRGRTEGYNGGDWTEDYDKATYSKYFLQPQIGVTNDVFEGALVTRISAIDMKSSYKNYQSLGIFFEPGFVFKVGYKYVKYYTQIGFSVPVSSDSEEMKFDNSVFNISFGLNISFGGYNNKK